MDTQIQAVVLAIITGLPATILAAATLIQSIRNGKKSDEIKVATDGMKDALVAGAHREGHAEGVKDEKASVKRAKS